MKKILILTLLFALAMTASPALAHGGADRIAGDITALDPATGIISLQPRHGDPVTVQTSADTEFYRKVRRGGLEAITFDDLAVGDRVLMDGEWAGDVFNAGKVVVLASAPTPPPPPEGKVHGLITALDPATGIISVQPRDGDPVTVQTSADTEFYQVRHHGGLEPITFDDLEVGEGVRAEGAWDGGVFNAVKVIAMSSTPPPPPGDMVGGIIATLDSATGVITVQPRDGDPVTVQTSADTEFYRMVHHGGLEPITFDDLAVGDRIGAEGDWEGDVFNANRVIAMSPPPPPPEDAVGGVITALDPAAGLITVQPHDGGDLVTVQTSADTEFYRMVHHGGLEPITFDDLAVGDRIGAEGAWDGDVFNAVKVIVMSDGMPKRILPIRERILPTISPSQQP